MLVAYIAIKRNAVSHFRLQGDTVFPHYAAAAVFGLDQRTLFYRVGKKEHTPRIVEVKVKMGNIFEVDKKIALTSHGFVFDLIGLGGSKKLDKKGEKSPRF